MDDKFADTLNKRTLLSDAERKVAELFGEQQSLNRRREVLSTEVGIAKGRLANKGKVSEFLEQLQSDANARLVSNYEMLLTALVTEVLPNEAPIGLDLQIERGQPSLDIVSRRSGDRSEDIYEDQGGALTNLVSLGLRMIGVVRSGMNRFLMLDESDCWIATDRVPAFYGVVKDAAKKIGVQCLAVSHHDVTAFDDGISIAKLSGHPELPDGVRIENSPRPHQWSDEEKGIRWIRLKNFQGYVDETLHLSPGVNALVGLNNIGKSSFVRAFRAVFYGEARDSLIRWGERICSVEFGMPGGRVLSWDRQARRNPINRWRYLEADGSLVGEEFNTGGRAVPAWVMSEFKIGQLEGMDIHAIKQKEPVFLLNQPASKRAAVLSIGQEASHIRSMVTLHKEQCASDNTRVKEGEAEMGILIDRLEKLSSLPKCKVLLEKANAILLRLQGSIDDTSKLKVTADNLASAQKTKEAISSKVSVLGRLPEAVGLRSLEQSVVATSKIEDAFIHLAATKQKVSLKEQTLNTLSRLPEAEPSLVMNERMETLALSLEDNVRRIKKYEATLSALKQMPESHPKLKEVNSLSEAVAGIISANATITQKTSMVSALGQLPDLMPEIVLNEEAIRCGKALRDARHHVTKMWKANAILSLLPESYPQLASAETYSNLLTSIQQTSEKVITSKKSLSECQNEMLLIETEINEIVEVMGHRCPLCHNSISDATSLLEHGHMEINENV